jgi:integrase/recombinase XerD
VLAQPDVITAIGLRDRAILEVFYSTGIRRLELIHLVVQDLDADRGMLMLRLGKCAKPHDPDWRTSGAVGGKVSL